MSFKETWLSGITRSNGEQRQEGTSGYYQTLENHNMSPSHIAASKERYRRGRFSLPSPSEGLTFLRQSQRPGTASMRRRVQDSRARHNGQPRNFDHWQPSAGYCPRRGTVWQPHNREV